MNYPAERREALEELWRGRVQSAMNCYRDAKAECAKAISAQSDVEPPDGSFAYRRALRIENTALAEYRRVLTIFTDLTVSGVVPPED